MQAFFFAIQFLSRLPIKGSETSVFKDTALAVPWFPLVGLMIGSLLAGFAALLMSFTQLPAFLSASLVVLLWVIVTGALHLDGLADCADAWMSCSVPEKMLTIMKDPACGTGGVLALLLAIGLKVAAVTALLEYNLWFYLILPVVAGRVMLVFAIMFIPYLRQKGLGKRMTDEVERFKSTSGIAVVGLVVLLIWPGATFVSLVGGFLGMIWVKLWIVKPLGGATGDVYGAIAEVAEIGALIGLVLIAV